MKQQFVIPPVKKIVDKKPECIYVIKDWQEKGVQKVLAKDFDYAGKKLRIKVDTFNYEFLTRCEWFLTKQEAIDAAKSRKETKIRFYQNRIKKLESISL
jgi:exopolysaccharide biosynthesis predicted pyruvyltransferase EpsI